MVGLKSLTLTLVTTMPVTTTTRTQRAPSPTNSPHSCRDVVVSARLRHLLGRQRLRLQPLRLPPTYINVIKTSWTMTATPMIRRLPPRGLHVASRSSLFENNSRLPWKTLNLSKHPRPCPNRQRDHPLPAMQRVSQVQGTRKFLATTGTRNAGTTDTSRWTVIRRLSMGPPTTSGHLPHPTSQPTNSSFSWTSRMRSIRRAAKPLHVPSSSGARPSIASTSTDTTNPAS